MPRLETSLSQDATSRLNCLTFPSPDPSAAPRPLTLQERVAAGILEAAARVFAAEGERANMADVAAGAGVARATLYRYFASRSALLDELGRLAVARAGERLGSARVDEVAAHEGVSRAVRAMIEVGDLFVVLKIVVPRKIDEKSRELLEEFGRLNPQTPRADVPWK